MQANSLGFTIGKWQIGYYGLLIAVGIAAAVLISWHQAKKRGLPFDNVGLIFAVCGLGVIIGAKLLYLIVSWRQIEFDRLSDLSYINSLMQGGFVFYGGVLGGLLGALVCKVGLKIRLKDYVNIIVPGIPIGHGFGRLGCAVVGCCYGMPYNGPLAAVYTHSLFAPNHISLFPVQATEAVLEFCIGIFLLIYVNKLNGKRSLSLYLFFYAVVRFVLEFFRYDYAERGFIAALSVSQWISLLMIAAIVALFVLSKRRAQKSAG